MMGSSKVDVPKFSDGEATALVKQNLFDNWTAWHQAVGLAGVSVGEAIDANAGCLKLALGLAGEFSETYAGRSTWPQMHLGELP